MTPVVRLDWELEITGTPPTKEIFNSDGEIYGGTGTVFNPAINAKVVDGKEQHYKLILNLPPLGAIILK
jgi:1,4-alpha-glucan branching enzyme